MAMATYFSSLQDAVKKRVAYHRTVRGLRNLHRDVALDLDIYPGDAERIAREAVYGR